MLLAHPAGVGRLQAVSGVTSLCDRRHPATAVQLMYYRGDREANESPTEFALFYLEERTTRTNFRRGGAGRPQAEDNFSDRESHRASARSQHERQVEIAKATSSQVAGGRGLPSDSH